MLYTKLFQLHLALTTYHNVNPVLLVCEITLSIRRFEETFFFFFPIFPSVSSALRAFSVHVLKLLYTAPALASGVGGILK